MAVVLQRVKAVWNCARERGVEGSAFGKALEGCVKLAFEARSVKENGKMVDVLLLKEKYKSLTSADAEAEAVRGCLERAYAAYHEGSARPLSYDVYEMFVRACRDWGTLVGNKDMQTWYMQTKNEHSPEDKKREVDALLARMKELGV